MPLPKEDEDMWLPRDDPNEVPCVRGPTLCTCGGMEICTELCWSGGKKRDGEVIPVWMGSGAKETEGLESNPLDGAGWLRVDKFEDR